jgi:hypothetical protein
MFKRLKDLFLSKKKQELKSRFSAEQYSQYYEIKKQGLEKLLGEMYPLVGHAILPFQFGGLVDLYFFPNVLEGTGFVTMELIEPDGSGPKPSSIGTYELIAFTRYKIGDESTKEKFDEIEHRICETFTAIANYSHYAQLNPLETAELPVRENEPNRWIIFTEYKKSDTSFMIGNKKHGLLLVIEVFESEMEYAMKHGSESMLNKLMEKGCYPYSDLDREALA